MPCKCAIAAAVAGPDDKAVPSCVVVDDHQEVLDSVVACLRAEGIDVIGSARAAAEATRLLSAMKPDVAILDHRLPDSSGIEIARALSVASPATAPILYSGAATRALVAEALAAGVRAVVLKESSPAVLLRAIASVVDGRRFIDPQLRRRPGTSE